MRHIPSLVEGKSARACAPCVLEQPLQIPSLVEECNQQSTKLEPKWPRSNHKHQEIQNLHQAIYSNVELAAQPNWPRKRSCRRASCRTGRASAKSCNCQLEPKWQRSNLINNDRSFIEVNDEMNLHISNSKQIPSPSHIPKHYLCFHFPVLPN